MGPLAALHDFRLSPEKRRGDVSTKQRNTGRLLAAALTVSVAFGLASVPAEAQQMIGAARAIPGSPVAANAVHARFVWGGTGSRIIVVNQADEVFYHRVHNNRVDREIRMRGHTVGHRGDPTEYVVPWGDSSILVVTQSGLLYRHDIRRETIGPAAQIPGAPVGTQGQDPVFMFRVGPRLINVTSQGEVWAHNVTRTVSPPQRLGRVAIATPQQVRHVFNVGRTVYIISDQGQIYRHDVHPHFGRGTIVQSRYAAELGSPDSRFAFVMGNGLYIVNRQGTLWVRDVSRLLQGRSGVRGQFQGQPAPTPAPAPTPPG